MHRYNNIVFPYHPIRGHGRAPVEFRGVRGGRNMGDPCPSHSIPVEKFHYGGDEDFDDWIQSFENACIMAIHPESPDAKLRLYLEWLPLKLDTQALALYRQKTKVDYPDVKAEMRTMLTDPHEAFNWKANTKAFLWDGRTPLHSVAAYIQKKVSKNEKSPGEDAKKEASSGSAKQ
jgi:hypothetical protein